MKCILFLVLTLFSGQIWCQRFFRQERQQLCYTPENYYGICVRLTACPSIVNYYGQSRGSQAAVQYLLQVQRACGTRSVANDPVVCCEEAYNNYYRPNQVTTPRPNPFTQLPPTQPPPPPTQPPTLPPIRTQPPTPPPPPTQPPTPPPPITQPPTAPTVNNRASNCRGPDLRPGNCMDVRNCQELLDALINNSQNATVGNLLRLSNEICRNQGYTTGTSVCCPVDTAQPTSNPRTNGNGRAIINGPECGLSTVDVFRKVVGGQPAKQGAWPWITLLGYDVLEGSPFKCGGTLITQRHVMTAAHCIRSDLRFVRLGEHDLSTTTEARTVDINIVKMDRHPDYNSRNGKNDIAILHLESPVTYTDFIHPACLPRDEPLRSRSFVDFMPFVAGWGRTTEGGKPSEILQQLQLPVLANQVCRERYAAQRRLVTEDQFDDAVLCAGVLTGGMDTCQGDSGGPLMYPEQIGQQFKFNVIGIVSYGVGCARAEIPGAYSNVAHFIDWIEEKISA